MFVARMGYKSVSHLIIKNHKLYIRGQRVKKKKRKEEEEVKFPEATHKLQSATPDDFVMFVIRPKN